MENAYLEQNPGSLFLVLLINKTTETSISNLKGTSGEKPMSRLPVENNQGEGFGSKEPRLIPIEAHAFMHWEVLAQPFVQGMR